MSGDNMVGHVCFHFDLDGGSAVIMVRNLITAKPVK
jgi:hypothetical protein